MLRRVLIIPVFGLLLAGIAAGCTDTKDLEDRIGAIEQQQTPMSEQLQTISDATQRSAMVTALTVLGGAGLHEIDESAAAGQVDAGASGSVDAAILAMSAVDWPDDLKTDADALVADLQALLTALDSADAATVADPAHTAHEAEHDFEHAAANYIKAAVGLPTEEEHSDEEGTPSADETPAEGG